MKKTYSFLLSDGQKIDLALSMKQLSKYPEVIADEILSTGQYCIKTKVEKKIFEDFINHLLDNDQNLSINENNIIQIHLLNIEFGIESDFQSLPAFKQAFNTSAILNINLKENLDKSNDEKYIAQNLDTFLIDYTEQMYNIPINSLYNIFNHSDRQLDNQDIAYKFITNTLISERNNASNNNIFILLDTLDWTKLSPEIQDDCISKKNDHFMFMPKNCISFNEMTPNKLLKIQETINSLKDIVNQVQSTEQQASINLPNNLFVIPPNSFTNCHNLVEVIIPKSVISIGSYAFSDCRSLVNVVIPFSVVIIDSYAFCSCSSLAQITIPSSVMSIGNCAFYNCSSLTQIELPSTITSIGPGLFSGCKSLTQVTLPSTITSIGSSIFYGCKSLTQVTLPSTITSIGSGIFSDCESLTQVTLPSAITSIGQKFFKGCKSLEQIEIPFTVTIIDTEAFENCCSLKEIIIPSSVTEIKRRAFYRCNMLSLVTFHSYTISIDRNAFKENISIKKVQVPSLRKFYGIFPSNPEIVVIPAE